MGVVINELLANTDDDSRDSNELANLTAQPITIGGWYLSDSIDNLRKVRVPDGSVLAGGDSVVYDERDFDSDSGDGQITFALSGDSEDDTWLTTSILSSSN